VNQHLQGKSTSMWRRSTPLAARGNPACTWCEPTCKGGQSVCTEGKPVITSGHPTCTRLVTHCILLWDGSRFKFWKSSFSRNCLLWRWIKQSSLSNVYTSFTLMNISIHVNLISDSSLLLRKKPYKDKNNFEKHWFPILKHTPEQGTSVRKE